MGDQNQKSGPEHVTRIKTTLVLKIFRTEKLSTGNIFKCQTRLSFALVCLNRNLLNSLLLLTANGWIFVYFFYRWFQRSSRCSETC